MFPVLIDLGTWKLPLLGETPIFLPSYGVLFAEDKEQAKRLTERARSSGATALCVRRAATCGRGACAARVRAQSNLSRCPPCATKSAHILWLLCAIFGAESTPGMC